MWIRIFMIRCLTVTVCDILHEDLTCRFMVDHYVMHVHYVCCLLCILSLFVFSSTTLPAVRWWLRSLPAICGQWIQRIQCRQWSRRVSFGWRGGFGEAQIALASRAGISQGLGRGFSDRSSKESAEFIPNNNLTTSLGSQGSSFLNISQLIVVLVVALFPPEFNSLRRRWAIDGNWSLWPNSCRVTWKFYGGCWPRTTWIWMMSVMRSVIRFFQWHDMGDYYPLLTIIIHYYPLLTITIHYSPLLSTIIHYEPLLSTINHYYPIFE